MAKETAKCDYCGNYRIIFYGGMCQTCYRKSVKEDKNAIKYVRTGDNKDPIVNEILDLFLNEGKSRKEIYEIINAKYNKCIYRYICMVIQNNTRKVSKWRL